VARLDPGPLKLAWRGEVSRVFVQGAGQAAQGARPAGCGRLVFEAADGGQADPGAGGELFLGQAVLVA
jgi:hypothetical protein